MIKPIGDSLKYPPYKYLKKLPDKLLWYGNDEYYYEASIFTTKNPVNWSKLVCKEATQYTDNGSLPSLFIHLLISHPRKQGLGRAIIDFAKKFSEQIGCEGRIHLAADPCFTPNEAPHIFYKKCGFNTGDRAIDNLLDKYIKKDKNGNYKTFPKMLMYYPPRKYSDTSNDRSIYKKLLLLWNKL